MSQLHVVHTTRFDYAAPVTASYNEIRMTPVDGPSQQVRSASVTIVPSTWSTDHVDYWGTAVTSFEVLDPHSRLTIVAESVVEVADPAAAPALLENARASWAELASPAALDRFSPYLTTSATTAVPEEVAHLAGAATAGADPHTAAQQICRALRAEVEYVPGVTTVHTPATEAWVTRKGVCQDMAHLSIGALRSVGIPARYVSGYLYPRAGGGVGETVLGESHAWIEWWAGDWVGFDPTNDTFTGGDHVAVGRGREYTDVAPLKGVFAGAGSSTLEVSVAMTRR